MENKTVLEVSGAGRTFPDGTVALTDISFAINQGEFAVIAGSNGSGKSVQVYYDWTPYLFDKFYL